MDAADELGSPMASDARARGESPRRPRGHQPPAPHRERPHGRFTRQESEQFKIPQRELLGLPLSCGDLPRERRLGSSPGISQLLLPGWGATPEGATHGSGGRPPPLGEVAFTERAPLPGSSRDRRPSEGHSRNSQRMLRTGISERSVWIQKVGRSMPVLRRARTGFVSAETRKPWTLGPSSNQASWPMTPSDRLKPRL